MALLLLLACGLAGQLGGASAAQVALGGTAEARQRGLEAAWGRELDAKGKESPAKRVVGLLRKMKAQLDEEADKESEMYDKMVCWCETNDKEKTQAIAEAEAKDKQLSAEIEGRAARFGQLSAEVANGKEEIAANSESLSQATAIREKEAAEFRAGEQDLAQAVTNLRNAIQVLSKHQGGSLLQVEGPVLSGMRVLLRDAALKYEVLVAGRAERRGRGSHEIALVALSAAAARREAADSEQGLDRALLSALDLHDGSVADLLPLKYAARLVERAAHPARAAGHAFLQVEAGQPVYESRSSARSSDIFGIMSQMQAEFEAELKRSQDDELQAQADYEALAAAKEAEIEAGKKKLDEMEVEGAGNEKALADAKEDLTNTREQRTKDVEFQQNLKLTCNDLDAQWEKRSKTRSAEAQAVAETIAILTEDDNREMLAKSVTLLQLGAGVNAAEGVTAARRARAVAALRRAADAPEFEADDLLAAWHGRHAPMVGAAAGPRAQLSTLALTMQLDSFTKVKEMMDTMVAALKEQQAEEVKFKEYCAKELDTNAKSLYDKGELKKDLQAKIDQLGALIGKLEKEIAAAQEQVAATEVEIKKAGQAREAENKEFQAVVADQRATQDILKKALQRLKDFYEKGLGKAVLVQRDDQTPPVQFNAYKTNAGASPVMGLIAQIIEDSKALEKATTEGEFEAQADYERFVKDSNSLIKSLQEAITANTKAIAAAKGDIAETEADLASTDSELESLTAYEADLHGQCDFVLQNFDVRQKARLQEMEAIQAAKGILSGAR